jgi:hypothetical protein
MKPTTEVTESGVTSPGHSDAMGHNSCDRCVCRQVPKIWVIEQSKHSIYKGGRDYEVCGEKSFRAFCSFSKVISRASMREISICVAN